jgi:hypothetical protein
VEEYVSEMVWDLKGEDEVLIWILKVSFTTKIPFQFL